MLLELGPHTIDCTDRTAIMGILNVSDDSPVVHSRVALDAARDRAQKLVRQGAEIIDIGANSTLTGSRELSAEEEIERVVPLIEGLVADGVVTSVDTWNPAVARAAGAAGVHLLNDVTGFVDPAMVAASAEFGVPGIVMHMRGRPKLHNAADQRYTDIATEVQQFLLDRAEQLQAAAAPRPWLDPGFEFGKPLAANLALYEGLRGLVATGYPVLISASRKGFFAELLGHGNQQDIAGLLEATIAFNTLAADAGVHIIRVHDVEPMAQALTIVNGIRRARAESAPTAKDAR
jgi:dihydropteroate synthase